MDDVWAWVRDRWALLAALGLALLLGFGWWQGRPVSHPRGILAPADPIQTAPLTEAPWTHRNHRITPLARFEIRARVLGAERYRFDRASELSPVDLALGWGPMSDSQVLESLEIRQRDRWYFWSASRLPISAAEITTHSANMHLIPATEAVARRLLAARPGQLAELSGHLVRVDGKDGWHWISSLSRADTGDGSCEVVWVESARLTDR
jgi:hypothetical protein